MNFILEINMDNEAFFDSDGEACRNTTLVQMLRVLANKIEKGYELNDGMGFAVMDENGNKVGQANVLG